MNYLPKSKLFRLFNVSSSGYYDWLKRRPSQRQIFNERLDQTITELFFEHKKRYGYRRIYAYLLQSGYQVSSERVRRRMKKLSLKARQYRKYRCTTDNADSCQILFYQYGLVTKLGLKRMLLASLYLRLYGEHSAVFQKYYPNLWQRFKNITEQEFMHPGHGGESINHTLFLDYDDGKIGYHLTPYEDDAHAVQEIILYYEYQYFKQEREKNITQYYAVFMPQKANSYHLLQEDLPRPTDHHKTYPKPNQRR